MDLSGIDAPSALLIAGGAVLFSLLFLAVVTDRQPRKRRPDPERLRAAAEQLEAYAIGVQTDAGRAAAIAGAARVALAAAERERHTAWLAQEAAERDYERAWQAVLAGREAADRAPAPAEPDPEQDRAVSRAALAAYKRGDLSLAQLREVFGRSGHRDPAQEQRERLLERSRMLLAEARRAYERAAAMARRAEQETSAAEAVAWELHSEANRAVAEAREAYDMVRRFGQRRGGRNRRRRRRAG
ncbi:hypothetical protein [Plantactinospora sp. B5E13]|uniref:hypothetical protein n=1 Tax=unclassified Plantactinospora TaxID=2631981 RepID=UPI00325F6C3F